MTKQTIKFHSPNRYFGGFLQDIINRSEVQASVSQTKDALVLLIDENDQNIKKFNENIAKYLPHSLFLGKIETTQTTQGLEKTHFDSPQYNIAPCNRCLELLNDPSSEYYLDESLKCDHYSNPVEKNYEDYTIFSPHYSEGSSVLITNASKIHELFILTDDEITALFSIEKPTIKATIKDETLKNLTGKKFIYVKAPYNNRSTLASINAKESEVDYLFFQDLDDLKVVVVQQNKTIIKASRVATPLENLHDDPVVNRFLNIKNEANFDKGAIAANLSTKGISFLVSNELGSKAVITLDPFCLETLLENFQKSEKRATLFENFRSKEPTLASTLEQNRQMDFFETIATILELDDKTFGGVSDKGYEFRGNGGLKIDTNFTDEGFDYDSFIGSIISFKLAGVEMHYLAYSIFEAFADMAINTLNQLKTKFKIENIIMMGDMFQNSVLYSRILSKYQLSNPYFSKSIALDG
jgi:hypothetical protein